MLLNIYLCMLLLAVNSRRPTLMTPDDILQPISLLPVPLLPRENHRTFFLLFLLFPLRARNIKNVHAYDFTRPCVYRTRTEPAARLHRPVLHYLIILRRERSV